MKTSKKLFAGLLCVGLLGSVAQSQCSENKTVSNAPTLKKVLRYGVKGAIYGGGAFLIGNTIRWSGLISFPKGESKAQEACTDVVAGAIMLSTNSIFDSLWKKRCNTNP